MFYAFDVLILG